MISEIFVLQRKNSNDTAFVRLKHLFQHVLILGI